MEVLDEFVLKLIENKVGVETHLIRVVKENVVDNKMEYGVYFRHRDVVLTFRKIVDVPQDVYIPEMAKEIEDRVRLHEQLSVQEYSVVHYVHIMTSLSIFYKRNWFKIEKQYDNNIGSRLTDYISEMKAKMGGVVDYHKLYKNCTENFMLEYLEIDEGLRECVMEEMRETGLSDKGVSCG